MVFDSTGFIHASSCFGIILWLLQASFHSLLNQGMAGDTVTETTENHIVLFSAVYDAVYNHKN